MEIEKLVEICNEKGKTYYLKVSDDMRMQDMETINEEIQNLNLGCKFILCKFDIAEMVNK